MQHTEWSVMLRKRWESNTDLRRPATCHRAIPDLSPARWYHAITATNYRLMVCGGVSCNSSSSSSHTTEFFFQPPGLSHPASTSTPTLTSRAGRTCRSVSREHTYAFHFTIEEMSSFQSMSTTRKYFAMVTYADAAYAFGGQNSGNSDLNSLERWNRKSGWVTLASMPYTNFRYSQASPISPQCLTQVLCCF